MQHSLIDLILEDHKTAKDHLTRFPERPQSQREDAFCELVHLLVAHEIAEEVVAYPAFRKEFPSERDVAEERIEEQNEAESLLSKMEHLDVSDPEFMSTFETLRSGVLEHARLEEETVFGPLSDVCSEEDLARLGDEYQRAKQAAPTHPHPHAPAAGKTGATLLGLADRTRDAVTASKESE